MKNQKTLQFVKLPWNACKFFIILKNEKAQFEVALGRYVNKYKLFWTCWHISNIWKWLTVSLCAVHNRLTVWAESLMWNPFSTFCYCTCYIYHSVYWLCYGAYDPRFQFSLLQNIQTGIAVHPTSYSISTGYSFPFPSKAEVKNKWNCTSLCVYDFIACTGTTFVFCLFLFFVFH